MDRVKREGAVSEIVQSKVADVPSMTVTYQNKRPVELADLTVSLQTLSRRFARYAAQNDLDLDEEATKLYVKEIRPGSLIVELWNLVAAHPGESGILGLGAATTLTQDNAIVTFAKSLAQGLNSLAGKDLPSKDLPTAELRDLAKFVEPKARDSSFSISILAKDSAQVQVSISYGSNEANAIQNRAQKEIESRNSPIETNYKKVLMYWRNASTGASSRSDKALIDKIWDKPLKVLFDDDDQSIKSRMITGRDNPFNIGFIVDVELLTKGGRPAAYRVTHLYEVLDDDEDDGDEDGGGKGPNQDEGFKAKDWGTW